MIYHYLFFVQNICAQNGPGDWGDKTQDILNMDLILLHSNHEKGLIMMNRANNTAAKLAIGIVEEKDTVEG